GSTSGNTPTAPPTAAPWRRGCVDGRAGTMTAAPRRPMTFWTVRVPLACRNGSPGTDDSWKRARHYGGSRSEYRGPFALSIRSVGSVSGGRGAARARTPRRTTGCPRPPRTRSNRSETTGVGGARQVDQDESAHVIGLCTAGSDPCVQAPAAEYEVRQGVVALINQHPDCPHRGEIDDEHDQGRRGCGIHWICLLRNRRMGRSCRTVRRRVKTDRALYVLAARIREWVISRFVVPTTRIGR